MILIATLSVMVSFNDILKSNKQNIEYGSTFIDTNT